MGIIQSPLLMAATIKVSDSFNFNEFVNEKSYKMIK